MAPQLSYTMRVGVVGATGYAGAELVRLLARHPAARITALTSISQAGCALDISAPHLRGLDIPLLEAFELTKVAERCDVVFLAQESGFAMQVAGGLIAAGCRVVDLSADFRLRDAATYVEWYGMEHTAPELLRRAVYGLPELVDHSAIASADLIANPGCYPTGACLAIAPLLAGHLASGTIIVDAKSGVSGAGRSKVGLDYHFAELEGSFKAYNPVRHRHVPEIEQTISSLVGSPTTVRFTPHLVPISRGIFTTAHVPLARDPGDLDGLYEAFYASSPFVQILSEGQSPATKHVLGSNAGHVAVSFDPRTNFAVCVSVIDNLTKGAAGQAVQNMNIMFGIEETTGLDGAGVFP